MCCSFNMKKAEHVFKTGKYKKAISSGQSKDSENGFDSSRTPDWYERNNEPMPEV